MVKLAPLCFPSEPLRLFNYFDFYIFSYTQEVSNEDIWWDYVDRFDTFCLKQKNPDGSHKYTEECSHQVMDLIVLGLKDYVKVTNIYSRTEGGHFRNLNKELSGSSSRKFSGKYPP